MAEIENVLDSNPSYSTEDVRQMLSTDEKGRAYQSIDNCMIALQNDPVLAGAICHNDLTCKTDIIKNLGWDKPKGGGIRDVDVDQIDWYLELFIKAANRLFSERDEILANTKVMMEMVCETDSLDRDLQDSITELNIISEQMQIAIAENSRVALNQDEYEKHYAELTARYEKAKAGYDDIAEQIESKKAKRELFKGFIRTLEKQDGITCEFDAGIWSSLVQEVIVKAKDDIRFIFKNGFEVRV